MSRITFEVDRDDAHTIVNALRRLANSRLAADAREAAAAARIASRLGSELAEHDRNTAAPRTLPPRSKRK